MTATVRDVMTTEVIALRKTADFKEIVSVLRRYRVSACPVIDDRDRVLGVVSEADLLYKETEPDRPPALLRFQWRLDEEYKSKAVTAGQLMTSPAITIRPGVAVVDAARLMQDRRIKRLPVVDNDGQLIGIITRSDVLAIFERPDEDICAEVTKIIIGTEFGLEPADFEVTVQSGVVTVEGLVELRRTATDLVGRIRHAEGVVSVRNRLSFDTD
ncbi:MAG: CBS domain-containing protein [Streptosporangiaceae bacterium]